MSHLTNESRGRGGEDGTDDGAGSDNTLAVRVLGRTTVGGTELTGRQRELLAALAFHHRGATTDVLIDAVWGDDPPRAARQSLHNQITRLRRRFGADLVVTDLDCYRLAAEPDAVTFERLAAPWSIVPAGPAAIEPLRRALSLWRGAPYADLPDHHHAVAPERARLTDLRSRAMERLAVALLRADDARAAIVELGTLLEDEPYREHTWGLLMVALHRDGRRGEALAAYARAEERFGRELGIRPGAGLQGLAARIGADGVIDLASWTTAEPPHEPPPRCEGRPTPTRRCGGHRTRRRV